MEDPDRFEWAQARTGTFLIAQAWLRLKEYYFGHFFVSAMCTMPLAGYNGPAFLSLRQIIGCSGLFYDFKPKPTSQAVISTQMWSTSYSESPHPLKGDLRIALGLGLRKFRFYIGVTIDLLFFVKCSASLKRLKAIHSFLGWRMGVNKTQQRFLAKKSLNHGFRPILNFPLFDLFWNLKLSAGAISGSHVFRANNQSCRFCRLASLAFI